MVSLRLFRFPAGRRQAGRSSSTPLKLTNILSPGWERRDAGWEKVVTDSTDAAPEDRCPSALIIKGEWFGCDHTTDHGTVHSSGEAEAVWGTEPTQRPDQNPMKGLTING